MTNDDQTTPRPWVVKDELAAALERYATHAADCSVRQALGIRCDCGLADVFQRYVLPDRYTTGYFEYSSIDGVLDLISVKTNPAFTITEHGSRRSVRARITDELLPIAKDALGHRVVAEGRVHCRDDGTPISITIERAEDIFIRPEPTRDLADFVNSDPKFTRGMPASEYVRRMRSSDG